MDEYAEDPIVYKRNKFRFNFWKAHISNVGEIRIKSEKYRYHVDEFFAEFRI